MVDSMSFTYCLLIRFSSINVNGHRKLFITIILAGKSNKIEFSDFVVSRKNVYAIAFIIQYAYRSFSHQWTDEQADK